MVRPSLPWIARRAEEDSTGVDVTSLRAAATARKRRKLQEQDYWRHWRSIEPEPVACCVCGSTTTARFLDAPLAPGDVVRCTTCSMVFVSPVTIRGLDLSPEQEAEAERLRSSSDIADLDGCWEMQFLACEEARTASDRDHRDVLARLLEYLPDRGRMLDFGAGWGQFTGAAAADGWDVIGIEPTPGRALHAREAKGLDVRTTTLTPDLFPPEHFDAVVSLQVFEHLDDPAAEVDRIFGVLRPGGILAIEVPSIASPLVRLMGGSHRHFTPDHFWFFSPETLKRMLRTHGFVVRETYLPTRHLSLSWVSQAVLRRYVPDSVGDALVNGVKHSPFSDTVVPLNVGDVVMAIAQKPR